jgi:prolipoprotein diacylglyceryltransferase
MYPLITFGDAFSIHTFGIFMIGAWILFFGLVHIQSLAKGIGQHIFSDILSFTLVPFLVGRVFYIFAEWREEQYIFVDLIEGK